MQKIIFSLLLTLWVGSSFSQTTTLAQLQQQVTALTAQVAQLNATLLKPTDIGFKRDFAVDTVLNLVTLDNALLAKIIYADTTLKKMPQLVINGLVATVANMNATLTEIKGYRDRLITLELFIQKLKAALCN